MARSSRSADASRNRGTKLCREGMDGEAELIAMQEREAAENVLQLRRAKREPRQTP